MIHFLHRLQVVMVLIVTLVLTSSCDNKRESDAVITSKDAGSSISQHGITWKFDKNYEIGQFANGDYWVLGPVKIVSIIPASIIDGTGRILNGSMVNPTPALWPSQGFDSKMSSINFEGSLNAARPGGKTLSSKNPLVLSSNSSLLSTISYPTPYNRPQLTDAAVLTVLATKPPLNSFRPPYVGKDKTIIASEADLDYSKLCSLQPPSNAPGLKEMSAYFVRPWIEIATEYGGREMHPTNNYLNAIYGRDLGIVLAKSMLLLQLNYTKAEKRDLLVGIIQYAIDIYGAAKMGATWPANGGHNLGRKMPLLLAATVLNDSEMLSYCDGTKKRIFQDDQNCFYVSQEDVDRSTKGYWTPDTRGGTPIPYATANIGMVEWGISHYDNPEKDNALWGTLYRDVVGIAVIGHVLTAHIMGLKSKWNWDATFDYYDRFWSIEGAIAPTGTHKIPEFVETMWMKYRTKNP